MKSLKEEWRREDLRHMNDLLLLKFHPSFSYGDVSEHRATKNNPPQDEVIYLGASITNKIWVARGTRRGAWELATSQCTGELQPELLHTFATFSDFAYFVSEWKHEASIMPRNAGSGSAKVIVSKNLAQYNEYLIRTKNSPSRVRHLIMSEQLRGRENITLVMLDTKLQGVHTKSILREALTRRNVTIRLELGCCEYCGTSMETHNYAYHICSQRSKR